MVSGLKTIMSFSSDDFIKFKIPPPVLRIDSPSLITCEARFCINSNTVFEIFLKFLLLFKLIFLFYVEKNINVSLVEVSLSTDIELKLFSIF